MRREKPHDCKIRTNQLAVWSHGAVLSDVETENCGQKRAYVLTTVTKRKTKKDTSSRRQETHLLPEVGWTEASSLTRDVRQHVRSWKESRSRMGEEWKGLPKSQIAGDLLASSWQTCEISEFSWETPETPVKLLSAEYFEVLPWTSIFFQGWTVQDVQIILWWRSVTLVVPSR
jgi:hypothetical protein